jgi:dTDP-glucose pyrophosphorylase
MNILVLMAGGSEAFAEAGYIYPKNLVELDGLPLAQRVIEALGPLADTAQFIFVIRGDENRRYHTGASLKLLLPSAIVLETNEQTAGAACTALLAIEQINNDTPLLIVNGDQIVTADVRGIMNGFAKDGVDGGVVVFEAVHPRWSYVKTDENGYVVEAAEKRPISNLATAGMYYFARGVDYVKSAMAMIVKDAHVGGVFYVCPAYNEMILRRQRIAVHKIERSQYFSLADPRGAQAYEAHLLTDTNREAHA